MSQEHCVLRCFSCETFQVHIVKKAKKWECKMCGAKQSLKQNYGKGSGKDCRAQVMKLNELRVQSLENSVARANQQIDADSNNDLKYPEKQLNKTSTSKWVKYLDQDELEEDEENWECEVFSNENLSSKINRTPEEMRLLNNDKEIRSSNFGASIESNQASFMIGTDNVKFEKVNQKMNDDDSIPCFEETKKSKFDEYISNNKPEDNNDLVERGNKSTNIFGSDPNDLDEIINITF